MSSRRRSSTAAAGPGGRSKAARALRAFVLASLALALFASLVSLCAGLTARATAANPGYVMDVVRKAGVFPEVREEFLSGLVESSGLRPAERAALRRALDDGIPVEWLEAQFERTLAGLADYLGSDADDLRIEVALVELKVYILMAVRKHMGEEAYLQAALSLREVPDYLDIGPSFDSETLRRIRPAWRAAAVAPLAAGGAGLVLSSLLWLVAGRGERGAGPVGVVWLAAGLAVVGSAAALGVMTASYLPAFVPQEIPELRSLPLRALAVTGLAGIRSALIASGAGTGLAGACLASVPRTTASLRTGDAGGRTGRG